MHKKLGVDTASTADLDWSKEYSIPYDIMLNIQTWGVGRGGGNHCLGTGWVSVDKL